MKMLILILFIVPLELFAQVTSLFSRPAQKVFNHSLSYGNRGGGTFYSFGYSLSKRYGMSNIEIGHQRMSVGLYMVNSKPFVINAESDDVYVGGNYIIRHQRIKKLVPSIGIGINIISGDLMGRASVDYQISYPLFISLSYLNSKKSHNVFCGFKIYLYR